QFEYANVKPFFDEDWLIGVSFNNKTYSVKQAALLKKKEIFLKELFI
ncbi:MAG: hypothetical protein GWN62_07245, partial [Aliifodinibius sp.]|nr:hypothetical protein [Fodinibius sp.]